MRLPRTMMADTKKRLITWIVKLLRIVFPAQAVALCGSALYIAYLYSQGAVGWLEWLVPCLLLISAWFSFSAGRSLPKG
jgi:hypothetical protein